MVAKAKPTKVRGFIDPRIVTALTVGTPFGEKEVQVSTLSQNVLGCLLVVKKPETDGWTEIEYEDPNPKL